MTEQAKIRRNKITQVENCLNSEFNERKLFSKKSSKYVAAFNYIDKILIPLSATSGGVSIISFTSHVGAPVRIANASSDLIYSLAAGIIKKLLSITRNKKKKHDKNLMLAISKLTSI